MHFITKVLDTEILQYPAFILSFVDKAFYKMLMILLKRLPYTKSITSDSVESAPPTETDVLTFTQNTLNSLLGYFLSFMTAVCSLA